MILALEILLVVTSVLLIALVLLHKGKGGGLSDMFGGGLSSTASGSSVAERNLDRITVAVSLIWAATIVGLGIIVARSRAAGRASDRDSGRVFRGIGVRCRYPQHRVGEQSAEPLTGPVGVTAIRSRKWLEAAQSAHAGRRRSDGRGGARRGGTTQVRVVPLR